MKKKKVVAMILTMVLGVSIVPGMTGCGKKEEAAKTKKGEPEFTVFHFNSGNPFNPDLEIWQEVQEKTGVKLKSAVASTNSDYETSFQNMVASGDLADIIGCATTAEIEKLGKDGGMIPLNDLIDEHAPHIKKALEENQEYRYVATAADGNIYNLPHGAEFQGQEFYWIRQDWLDKLGLKVPTTVDELHDVLLAFKNNDPNGNGKADEIPLFDRSTASDGLMGEYLNLWDSSTGFYPRDGKMTYEPITENYKYAVGQLAQWYKEGIVDQELFTRGMGARDTLLGNNTGGFTHDWISTGNYNDSLKTEVEGFNMVGIPPLKDQNGNVTERTKGGSGCGWGISSKCEDPVAAIKFMDYLFTEEGSDLVNFGIEGKTYTVDDSGKKTYTDEILHADISPTDKLREYGVPFPAGYIETMEYTQAIMSDAGRDTSTLYAEHPEWYEKAGLPALKMETEALEEYEKIMANIEPIVYEKLQAWVLGSGNVEEEFDDFEKDLKDRNIDRAVEIMQEAYDNYMEQ